jgi:hypothetical protein
MEEINWDYWLDLKSLKEWQASALSLGIDPKRIKRKLKPYTEPAKFEYHADETIGNEKLQAFLNRLDIIQNNKYAENFYLGLDEVYLEGFVKWAVTKKSFQNYFPKELQSYWAKELVDNLNGKLTQPKVTQSGLMKPEEWNRLAEQYAGEILESNPKIKLEEISNQIAKKFEAQGILSVKGELIKPISISRVLSAWGFNLKRINADKK